MGSGSTDAAHRAPRLPQGQACNKQPKREEGSQAGITVCIALHVSDEHHLPETAAVQQAVRASVVQSRHHQDVWCVQLQRGSLHSVC